MAGLLFYRVLELSMQRRLAVHELDASAPDWDGTGVDAIALLTKYNSQRSPRTSEMTALPKELDLARGRGVLLALEDPVVMRGAEERGLLVPQKFEGRLQARNKSVFAHGYSAGQVQQLSALEDVTTWHIKAMLEEDGFRAPADCDEEFDFVQFGGLT